MVNYNGIAVTDETNLYNEKITLQAMYNVYDKQWDELMPSFANHNHTKSIGYSKLTGIYIEPGKAYTTNCLSVCENEKEETVIQQYNYNHLYDSCVIKNIDKYNSLIDKLQNHIIGTPIKYWTNCVFIYNEGIVSRVFTKLCENIVNGLIDIELLSPVLPGIYKIDDYLIFAHKYFRRGYSYLNTLNTAFLSKFQELNGNNLSRKISIDLDCIGLAGTEHKEFEYQYWWGPKFSDDLNNIPLGVTTHVNEHYNPLLSEIRKTEFGWYIQDKKHTFECEEIIDVPNLKLNERELYACRFVHSMVNNAGIPVHLDGAIRAYTDEKMIDRLDVSIKDTERDTIYTKLWRTDGEISVEQWKEIITHYYRDNTMIGEYFGGKDENIETRIKVSEQTEVQDASIKISLPLNIVSNNGIRINLSFSTLKKKDYNYDVYIRPSQYVTYKNVKYKYIESNTLILYKTLNRNGLNVRYPHSKQITFNDLIFNFSVLECTDTDVAKIVIDSIFTLCKKWNHNIDDRIISFTITVPYDDRMGIFSFLGHINDFIKYYSANFNYIPAKETIFNWLSNSYQFITNNFSIENSIHPFDILKSHGNLSLNRHFVPREYIEMVNKDGSASLKLNTETFNLLRENNITAVISFFDEKVKCSKCSKDYNLCNCISTIDDDVCAIVEKATPIGLIWTNRSAFIK